MLANPLCCLGATGVIFLALCSGAVAGQRDYSGVKPGNSTSIGMPCQNNTAVKTMLVRGPGGTSAALVISSSDDHSINSHACMADYAIVMEPDQHVKSQPYGGFIGSDNAWDRPLAAKLFGFSQHGDFVFGLVSERGRYPLTLVFAYEPKTGGARIVKVGKQLALLKAARCGSSFAVAGTTANGDIVLAPDTNQTCQAKWRWRQNLVTPKGEGTAKTDFHRLSRTEPIIPLYAPPRQRP